MRRIVLLLLVTFLATSALIAAEARLVKLRVLDRGKPQAGIKVLVNYPDGVRSCGTTVTVSSDSEGIAAFMLPGNVFWVTVPSLNAKVIGKQFDVPEETRGEVRLNIQPREWRQEVKR